VHLETDVREFSITPNEIDGVDIQAGGASVDVEVYRNHAGITTVILRRDGHSWRFHGEDGLLVRKGMDRGYELPPFVDVVLDHVGVDYVEEEQ